MIWTMGAGPASEEQQWTLIVRRSFDIADGLDDKAAKDALVGHLEGQLQERGWHSSTRAIAQPMVDALMVMAVSGDLHDGVLPSGSLGSADAFDSQSGAYRLLDRGMTTVDPENLVFDARSDFPPEVVAVAQYALERVSEYLGKQMPGD